MTYFIKKARFYIFSHMATAISDGRESVHGTHGMDGFF
jgi:hypothetical protein